MAKDSFLINISGIGPVLFKADHRYKRLSIKIKPFEYVTVMFPLGYSSKKAMAFVEEKKAWITHNLKKIEHIEQRKTVFDENSTFRTHSFQLKVEKGTGSDIKMTLAKGVLNVVYPAHLPVTDLFVQNTIRKGIEEAMRLEAKIVLPKKVKDFASRYHFSYNKVFIKNLKSRWGSCSAVNNINLNLQLMRLPEHLIDYVVLHELCHTKEKNHGPGFWTLLNKVTGGKAKLLAAEMKQYRTTIY